MASAEILTSIVLGSLVLAVSAASAQPPIETTTAPPPSLAALRSEAIAEVDSGRLPSLSIGVLRGDQVLWQETIGWADRKKGVAATSRTPYGIASLGKSVTATAVMKLVESGKLDLDLPVVRYLGASSLRSAAGYADAVTIRHLLQMTASIPHGNYTYFDRRYADELDVEQMVKHRGLVPFPAGEVFTYSNFSYAVLEAVIEAVSSSSYETFLTEEVFEPLGMNNAFVAHSVAPTAGIARYEDDGEPVVQGYPHPRSSRAINASLTDLLEYARAHLGLRPLLEPATLHQMHTERGDPENASMALGWGSTKLDDDRLWLLSNGRSRGVQATLTLIPQDKLAVIVLTNRTGNVADEIAFRILDSLRPGFLEEFAGLKRKFQSLGAKDYAPEPELLGSWVGTIDSGGAPVEFGLDFQQDGDIHVHLGYFPTLLTDVRWRDGLLRGRFTAEIELEESAGHPHQIDLVLRPSTGSLEGYATAFFENQRGRFALSTLVRLSPKTTATSSTPEMAVDGS